MLGDMAYTSLIHSLKVCIKQHHTHGNGTFDDLTAALWNDVMLMTSPLCAYEAYVMYSKLPPAIGDGPRAAVLRTGGPRLRSLSLSVVCGRCSTNAWYCMHILLLTYTLSTYCTCVQHLYTHTEVWHTSVT